MLPSDYSRRPSGRRRAAGRPSSTARREESSKPSTNQELGTKASSASSRSGATSEEYATFTSEPPRESLIEPPPGYRTPSPTQPYGVGRKSGPDRCTTVNEPPQIDWPIGRGPFAGRSASVSVVTSVEPLRRVIRADFAPHANPREIALPMPLIPAPTARPRRTRRRPARRRAHRRGQARNPAPAKPTSATSRSPTAWKWW